MNTTLYDLWNGKWTGRAYRFLFPVVLAILATRTGKARADGDTFAVPSPHTYAIIVGSNPGGEGQHPLKYAEQDAARFGALLSELGRYPEQNLNVLIRPEPDRVLDALEQLESPLNAHKEAGEQAVLFFYYSGHARAEAMNLGTRELSLSTLRERLLTLPTTLTIVVLDACQSGAFSRTKGATLGGDFSFNSVSRLNTTGIAVMASSSESELSQESDTLEASYFTHHLLVALRGGGDDNQDGRVSLDEAYQYAHDHTLADTSQTAVGGQHPTLETDLTGRGDVPLTYPAEARAQIELPKSMVGKVLIQKPSGGAVMAELYKSAGRSLLLAFPAGRYDLLVRKKDAKEASIRQCAVELADERVTTIRLDSCSTVSPSATLVKGEPINSPPKDTATDSDDKPDPHERWAIELTLGFGISQKDPYIYRLDDFGFGSLAQLFSVRPALLGLYQLNRYFGLGAQIQAIEHYSSERFASSADDIDHFDRFEWDVFTLTLLPRGTLSLLDDWIAFYAQIGVGLGLGLTRYSGWDGDSDSTENQAYIGLRMVAGGGVQINFWKYLGMILEWSYDYAPVIRNLLDETHNSGGFSSTLGLRARIWS